MVLQSPRWRKRTAVSTSMQILKLMIYVAKLLFELFLMIPSFPHTFLNTVCY